MSKKIRLTESDLHRIIKESVNSLLVNGGYISKEVEPYFRAASKDELVSVISTWAKRTTNKDAVVELLELLKQFIHIPNDIWADYNENAWENKYGQ
ncbi:MAG: hypothetical protein J6W97_00785 [Bacteroidaceae bacterium]|nr:hypothetical protein [Bacteroidaceae bacterium]